jgi:hypothetical protein
VNLQFSARGHWSAKCAECGVVKRAGIYFHAGTEFRALLLGAGWMETAAGEPLCPACAKAKGEKT